MPSYAKMMDSSDAYANNKHLFIEFNYIPGGSPLLTLEKKTNPFTARFKAFLTSFSDAYSSNWNEQAVYGRMDPISTFERTARQISFEFEVVAASFQEAVDNYHESQKLLRFLYPVYEESSTSAATISSAPLLKLKFGNLIHDVSLGASAAESRGSALDKGLVGYLDGLSYAPDMEVGFFDNNAVEHIMPKINRFSCMFTVLHTHGLGWSRGGIDGIQERQIGFPYGNFSYSQEVEKESAGENPEEDIFGSGEASAARDSTRSAGRRSTREARRSGQTEAGTTLSEDARTISDQPPAQSLFDPEGEGYVPRNYYENITGKERTKPS